MTDNERTLKFIESYRNHPNLWDPSRDDYLNKIKRENAVAEVARENGIKPVEVKAKIKSLRSYFCREYVKLMKRKDDGFDVDDNTLWFAYKPLTFILDTIQPRKRKEKINCSSNSVIHEEYLDDASDSLIYNGNMDTYVDPLVNIDPPAVHTDKPHRVHKDPPPIKKRKTKRTKQGSVSSKLLNFAAKELSKKDDCTIFGDLVACQLQKLTPRNRAIAKRKISNWLFEMEIKQIDSTVVPHQSQAVDNSDMEFSDESS